MIRFKIVKYNSVSVKVYFGSRQEGEAIASTFEPLITNYEDGFHVLLLDESEFIKLNDAAPRLDLTIEFDQNSMNEYIINPRSSLPSSRNATTKPQSRAAFNDVDYASIPGYSCYRTVEGTYQTAEAIVAAFPDLASWTDVGDSWRKASGLSGYDQMVLRLTNFSNTGPKPKIFITSSIHAREYTPAELMTRFAEMLVTNYNVDADVTWILDHHDIHLMLIANPDGRKQAETGILWRKNTNQSYCGITSESRGVDLNRNFPFEWGCCGGSSTSGCSNTYRGPFGQSEPETQSIVNYLTANFDDNRGPQSSDAAPLDISGMYLDIHSSGRLMLWPWGSTSSPTPNGTQLQTLGRKLAFFNGHSPKQAIGLYPTDGTTTSYAYGELGLPSFTYELGTQFFQACDYFENTLIPDNFPSLLYALKTLRAPYQLPAGPEITNISIVPNTPLGVPAGTVITLAANADDSRYENSNGTEPSQAISEVKFHIDVEPWLDNNSSSASEMFASDGAFNAASEAVTAQYDTTGMPEGRYVLYVHGRDTDGNWGTVSAIFLDINNSVVLPTTVFADDFETDLGWTSNPNGTDQATTGQFVRANPQDSPSNTQQQLGTTVSGSFDLVTGPLAGSSVGTHDIDNGVTSIQSPLIDLPAGADSLELSFQYYLAHYNNASPDDFFRVYIVSGGSRNLVFEKLGIASQINASWSQESISLLPFAGETISIQFEAADASNPSLVEAAVDDVKIDATLGQTINTAPSVNAGIDQTIQFLERAVLGGSVTDDGLPASSPVVSTWSDAGATGDVTFSDANNLDTTVSFSVPGTYTLELVANDGELSNSDTVIVTVEPPNAAPTANLNSSAIAGTTPFTVTFDASTSSDSDGVIEDYQWDFGDGNTDTGAIVSHTYQTGGTFTATLTVTDDDGETDSASTAIEVVQAPNVAPNAAFSTSPATGHAPLVTTLDASASSDSDGSIVSYFWNFGDGGTASGELTSHTYAVAGSYLVVLTVTDSDGAEGTSSSTLTVLPPNNLPTSAITADTVIGDFPLSVNFSGANSSDGDGDISTYNWDFGDGNSASGINSTHIYSSAGTFVARLTVVDDDGATDSDSVSITVTTPNSAPSVNAGDDQTILISDSAILDGSVADDGLPLGSTTSSIWSQVSGPGIAMFSDASSLDTSVSFSIIGEYTLELMSSDTELSNSDQVVITVTEASSCPAGSLDFNQFALEPFSSSQDGAGSSFTISADGTELYTTGNLWKRSVQNYNITANTILEFDYASTEQGELHGIGFDRDQASENDRRVFVFWGTQNWVNGQNYSPKYTGNGEFQSFSIPVGSYYQGADMRLVFVNDKDAGATTNNGTFRCVRIREEVPVTCPIEESFEGGAGGWANASSTCRTGSFVTATPGLQTNSGVTTQVGGDRTSGNGAAFFTATNTSAGVNDVDGGECIAESPVYTVDDDSDISMWYFHGQRDTGDDSTGDFFRIDMSLDGGASWTTLESNGDQRREAVWTKIQADVPGNSQVKIRVHASDGPRAGDLIEAGLDDLKICPKP
ncbi:MAG: PKD domain-containing protein [Granulosicoccus sp.]